MKRFFITLSIIMAVGSINHARADDNTPDPNANNSTYSGTVGDQNHEEEDHIAALKKSWQSLSGNLSGIKKIIMKNYSDYEKKNGLIPKDNNPQNATNQNQTQTPKNN